MNVHLWQDAVSFAARAHQFHTRKDGRTPYVAHVYRVAMTVRDVFGCDDPIVLASAILHDTIEDTPTDYDDIAKGFGRRVADCVSALTKNMLLPEREREADYDRRLAKADWRARLVKLADVYDNYCDAAARAKPNKANKAKLARRCRRAIALARKDAAVHASTARGIRAVERLMARKLT